MSNKTYTEAEREGIFQDILEEIIEGRAIRNILKDSGMPRALSFFQWLKSNTEWQEQYAYACELRQELLFEKALDIAENPEEGTETTIDHNGTKVVQKDMIQHRTLKVNTIKWQLEKMNPKKYGSKIDVTSDNKPVTESKVVWNFIDAKKEKE
ncbi:MAG: hypothetical protein ACRCU6_06025 [Fusobacteriaceae bacterium]